MPEHLFAPFGQQPSEFTEGSVMLHRIRALNWSHTPAGSIESWPAEIKSAVRLILLSGSPMAVLIGKEGIVINNDALLEVLGDRYERALGRPVASALPMAAEFLRDAVAACYRGAGVRFLDQPIKLVRRGVLDTAWFSLSFTPIADIHANIFGVLVVASETTERMRALRALERSRQRMQLALEAGGIVGTWDLDVRTNRVTTSGAFAEMFGVSEEEARRGVSNDILSTSVHHQDRERVLETLRAAVQTGSDYYCRYRAVTRNGDIRWFVVSGRPLRDDRGRIAQLAGVVIDITEQTETAAALEQSNLRFDILAESIPQIVWSTNAEGRHDYFNRRWTEFTGIPPEHIDPTTWQELVHPDDWERVDETWKECLATGKTYDIDYRFRHKDGTYRWLWVLALPLRDAEGAIVRWYGTSSDIDAAKQLEEQRELVSRELDHRIKNLFALVNGLVGLSAREQPEHRPFANDLRARLEALDRAHGLIRGTTSSKPGSMRDVLQHLLAPYAGKHSDRIIVEGTDVAVDAGAITAIALIFHELITNAVKYGALAQVKGRLHISLHRDGDHQVIEWDERFEGSTNNNSGEGFGSRLLKAMVEGQLRGRMTRQFMPDGMKTHISILRAAFAANIDATDQSSS